MGLDSWADTGCSDKHAYVDECFEYKTVNVTGFTSTLISIDRFTITNVLYAFDKEYGTVVLFEHNNTIYMGDDMINSVVNPIKCEDNDVRIDLHPKVYDPNKKMQSQSLYHMEIQYQLSTMECFHE